MLALRHVWVHADHQLALDAPQCSLRSKNTLQR